MNAKAYFSSLADYHCWATDRLLAAVRELSDAQYRADCGLFFTSIHGTLNHLLLAETLWFGRITGSAFAISGLDQELESDREQLDSALAGRAQTSRGWIEGLGEDAFNSTVAYSNTSGQKLADPLTLVLGHVFNHATHHRGQVSAAVTGFGHAAPEMDWIYFLRG